MVKRILFFLVAFWITLAVAAQTVSREEAESFALSFLEQNSDSLGVAPRLAVQPRTDTLDFTGQNGRTYMYFVQTIDDGWIVVAADRRITPILAFGKGILPSLEEAPPAMIDLFRSNAYEMQYMLDSMHITEQHPGWQVFRNGTSIDNGIATESAIYKPGTALLNRPSRGYVNWNQGHPYNKFCPSKNDGSGAKCPVGCTAVAVGQIMWYWQWLYAANVPERVDKIAGTAFGNVFHEYDWNLMLSDECNATSQSEVDEIAGFLRDCGYALNSIYRNKVTTSDLVQAIEAFRNRFQYHCSNLRMRMFWNKSKWNNMLKSEIDAGRPVLYGGCKKDLSGAHMYVIDGYRYSALGDNDMLFHINWGWNDYQIDDYNTDGFFTVKLNNKEDSLTNYPYWQMAVNEIYPECNENVVIKNKTIKNSKTKPYYISTGGDLLLQNITVAPDSRGVFHSGNSIILENCRVKRNSEAKFAIRNINCSNVAPVSYVRAQENEDLADISLAEFSVDEDAGIYIYPNPSENVISIIGISRCASISIMNLQGIEVLRFDDVDSPLDISMLLPGIYLVKISDNDKSKIVKLIKH